MSFVHFCLAISAAVLRAINYTRSYLFLRDFDANGWEFGLRMRLQVALDSPMFERTPILPKSCERFCVGEPQCWKATELRHGSGSTGPADFCIKYGSLGCNEYLQRNNLKPIEKYIQMNQIVRIKNRLILTIHYKQALLKN